MGEDFLWDVFISHASEDKDELARPLAEALQSNGLRVWYDAYTLKMGDNLRKTIDRGLNGSTYGIVILSKAFFAKDWPQKELDGLFARERNGKNVILPIWHGLTKEEVEKYSPMLAGRYAAKSEAGMSEIVKMVMDVVEKRASDSMGSTKIIPSIQTYMGDQAVMEKIKEIIEWIPPTSEFIGNAAKSGDYLKMGINSALLRMYIDKNLPEMKQLVKRAVKRRKIAKEFIAMLEDLRAQQDFNVKAVDKYHAHEIDEGIQLLNKGREYSIKAMEHLNRVNELY
jgi:hypothetical protein